MLYIFLLSTAHNKKKYKGKLRTEFGSIHSFFVHLFIFHKQIANTQWITYGLPETNQIENAYKNGMKEIALTTGWFAENPNLYKVCFDNYENEEEDNKSTSYYQINSSTQTRREVRRIGVDDDKLFKKLKLSDLDEKDRKCMICLLEFNKKEEAEGLIVQLSTCKNHGFHLECISQWVQLKGNCPLCRVDVNT